MLLENKTAIVTGASRGIGKAIAAVFTREGATCYICGRKQDTLEQVARELDALPGRVIPHVCHVGKPEDLDRLVSAATAQTGRIDILVNNAGINKLEPAWEMSAETWDFVLRTNLYSTFYNTRAVLPHMVKQRSGKIVSLASVAGWIGSNDGEAHYCAAKAAVMGYTRAVAAEVGKYGIRVNAIAPGLIYNEFLRRIYPDEMFRAAEKRTPLGRVGQPQDIANLALFLVSDESSFITGEVMCCSGGLYVHA